MINKSGMSWSLLAAIAALAAQGAAAATIKIGGFEKESEGTVTSIEAGDVACYIMLDDANGESFTEMAEFEVCEQQEPLVGKRVSLGYVLGNVLADECQGNPDCGKSQQVALVSVVKVIGGAASGAATDGRGFCTPGETVVFNCQTGSKQASVCASAELSATSGYVQYRFGKPGAKLEMELPASQSVPIGKAKMYGRFDPYSGGGGAWLRFYNGLNAYVVYSGMGRWGDNGETMEKSGVVVEKKGELLASLPCKEQSTGELGPDWLETTGMDPANDQEEFYFPE